ncbi:hypothetical protein U1Q18_028482 [Sarracenia purpurea var. burkii]
MSSSPVDSLGGVEDLEKTERPKGIFGENPKTKLPPFSFSASLPPPSPNYSLSATARPFVLVLSPDDLIDAPASAADGDDSSTSEWDESGDSDSLSMIIAILPSDESHHDSSLKRDSSL